MNYNIFISYRRSSSDTANLIAEKLRGKGYNVFFDVESLRGGKFNEQLFSVIEGCDDFVLVLPPNALDRCSDDNDWVRLEVCHALACGKNIVPVMLQGFEWPEPMPKGMEELRNYQSVTATSHEYFDMAMDRMSKYLKSKPHKKIRKVLFGSVAAIAVLVILFFAINMILKQIAVPVCSEVADKLTMRMGIVDGLAANNKEILKCWESFKAEKATGDDLAQMLDYWEKEIPKYYETNGLYNIDASDYHSFLMGLYGVEGAVLDMLDEYYRGFIDDFHANINSIQAALEKNRITVSDEKFIDAKLRGFQHHVNAGYYSYLDFISILPVKAQKSYWKTGDKLENVPNGVGLNHSRQEFEQFVEREIREVENLLNSVEVAMNDDEEELRAKENELSEMEKKVAEVYKEMEDMYKLFVAKNMILESDDQWLKWGKITNLAKYMSATVEEYEEAATEGFEPGPVSPQRVFNDLSGSIDLFIKFHPASEKYANSARMFYKEVSAGTRNCCGQIVMAFKDNAKHPLYEIGDIIIERNGNIITNFESLTNAVANNGEGTVKFLRFNGSSLELHEEYVKKTDVLVGYLAL
ncbi:MAG: TIR domain-containing protein [Bacteroidales bacterium]|nr:TIR domain-containing protein [Bacteroidales bacterium]